VTRRLYSVVTGIAAPIAFAIVLLRGLRDRAYWEGLSERFGFGRRLAADAGTWLHAVSLGEVTAAAPLVRALLLRRPGRTLVLTTATPTGRARARSLFGNSVDVRLLPYDLRGSMRRFLERTRPALVVIMETELWPNLYRECARRNLPVLLGSARISEKSLRGYARFGALFRDVFAGRVQVGAQTAVDAARFRRLGAAPSRVHVTGNVKYDVYVDADLRARAQCLRDEYAVGGRPVWIAGSTHPNEEEQMLDAHALVRRRHENALLILVPRHPRRFDAVAALLSRRSARHVRRSALVGAVDAGAGSAASSASADQAAGSVAAPPGAGGADAGVADAGVADAGVADAGVADAGVADAGVADAGVADASVLLLDTTGELPAFYGCADVAFVGGSLVPIGGHNLLEPAALGVPVLTGPSDFNARDIALLLIEAGAARRVTDARELAAALVEWFDAPARRREAGERARAVVESNRGSVDKLLALIDALEGS
jgi:3-deoxy-D-manno-octulosonic-acid transferase